jgi:hypothetical protein
MRTSLSSGRSSSDYCHATIDERTIAQRKWLEALRPGKPQAACDHGLFSDEASQLDLIEMFQDPI